MLDVSVRLQEMKAASRTTLKVNRSGWERLFRRVPAGYVDVRLREFHVHRAAVGGGEHLAAVRLVGRGYFFAGVAAAAADDGPLGRAPGGEAGRVAGGAAVVRRQQHVAIQRHFRRHVFQAGRFQVAGQQQAAAGDTRRRARCCWRCRCPTRPGGADAALRSPRRPSCAAGRRPRLQQAARPIDRCAARSASSAAERSSNMTGET